MYYMLHHPESMIYGFLGVIADIMMIYGLFLLGRLLYQRLFWGGINAPQSDIIQGIVFTLLGVGLAYLLYGVL